MIVISKAVVPVVVIVKGFDHGEKTGKNPV
jgi:hypothetical protein